MNQYEDKEINYRHGDKIICGAHGKFSYRFRCGPAPKYNYYWNSCSCQHCYRKGQQGKVTKTYGNSRKLKYIQHVKQNEAAEFEGFKVRKRLASRSNVIYRMMYWYDYPERHVEKNWKSQRKTQYK